MDEIYTRRPQPTRYVVPDRSILPCPLKNTCLAGHGKPVPQPAGRVRKSHDSHRRGSSGQYLVKPAGFAGHRWSILLRAPGSGHDFY